MAAVLTIDYVGRWGQKHRKISEEAINLDESYGGLKQGSISGGDKWLDSSYILKVEEIGFPEGVDMRCQRNPGSFFV